MIFFLALFFSQASTIRAGELSLPPKLAQRGISLGDLHRKRAAEVYLYFPFELCRILGDEAIRRRGLPALR